MEDRLKNIEKKIENLETKLDILIELNKKNNDSCKKMSEHIDFVDNVYENVKHPLGYLCNKITKVIGNDIKDQKLLE